MPFHVCGAQQDNSTLCVPSDTNRSRRLVAAASPPVAPYQVGGGEPGYIAPHPKDTDIVLRRRQQRLVPDAPAIAAHRRTARKSAPIRASSRASRRATSRSAGSGPTRSSSRHADPNVLYTSLAARVEDAPTAATRGTAISGDLTRHDPKTMGDSGGPITHDMNSPEIYGTVFSIGPGKKDVNIIWAGSDDGLVQRHARRRQDLDERHADGHARLRPRQPDRRLVLRPGTRPTWRSRSRCSATSRPTSSAPATSARRWTKIVNGIPANDYVHAVREDPTRRGLLYAGTQHGVYVSYRRRRSLAAAVSNGLPDTPVVRPGGRRQRRWPSPRTAAASTCSTTSRRCASSAGTLGRRGMLFEPAATIRGLDRLLIDYYLKAQPKTLDASTSSTLRASWCASVTGQPPRPAGEGRRRRRGRPARAADAVPMAAGDQPLHLGPQFAAGRGRSRA